MVAAAPGIKQKIRLCTAHDGVRLAYATSGSGPPLVKVGNWLTHLEFDWQSPVWGYLLEWLSQRHTLVRYDQRGTGLSDWNVEHFEFEDQVRDLEAVVDAADESADSQQGEGAAPEPRRREALFRLRDQHPRAEQQFASQHEVGYRGDHHGTHRISLSRPRSWIAVPIRRCAPGQYTCAVRGGKSRGA